MMETSPTLRWGIASSAVTKFDPSISLPAPLRVLSRQPHRQPPAAEGAAGCEGNGEFAVLFRDTLFYRMLGSVPNFSCIRRRRVSGSSPNRLSEELRRSRDYGLKQ